MKREQFYCCKIKYFLCELWSEWSSLHRSKRLITKLTIINKLATVLKISVYSVWEKYNRLQMKWFSIESVCYFHSTVFFLHIVQRMSIQNQLSSEVNVSRESPGVRQQSIIQIAHLRNTHFIKSVWVLVFSSYIIICILFIVVI